MTGVMRQVNICTKGQRGCDLTLELDYIRNREMKVDKVKRATIEREGGGRRDWARGLDRNGKNMRSGVKE